jgi:hypothetical protein
MHQALAESQIRREGSWPREVTRQIEMLRVGTAAPAWCINRSPATAFAHPTALIPSEHALYRGASAVYRTLAMAVILGLKFST